MLLLRSQLICCSASLYSLFSPPYRFGRGGRDDVDVVRSLPGHSLAHSPALSRSDQKISALMTRTNAEISLTRSPAPRLFASFGFGRMNSMRGREARFIPYLPSKSSLVRGSDLLLNGYVADGLCHDTTLLPRHSVVPSASEFLGANGFLT